MENTKATKESFGDYLADRRLKADLSMGQVARAIGVTVVYYSHVESGKAPPMLDTDGRFDKLAAILRVDRDELLRRATKERGRVEVNVERANKETHDFVLLLARLVHENGLNSARIKHATAILRQEEHVDDNQGPHPSRHQTKRR